MTPIQETEIDMEKLEERTMPSLTWKINEEKAEVRGDSFYTIPCAFLWK